ncbi:DNA polymerase III subunit beta [Edaphobacter albus]|uniref:DNA polymerase III subunit beta n=1 Tax=Edaphobacter sp. 4G125 TaxID=2763071 RepID=UPI0016444148|nr:DNA polymerase III subunit beta [Edaphobacter sp. 4G125]QNI37495.1 DNA polymerase III subunit beta [Edaphobacter sp. 4G125]
MATAVIEAPMVGVKAGKVVLPLSSLQAALTKISPAIPGASCAVPVLRTIKIENTSTATTFTATDLEMAIRASVPVEQEPGGAFLIAAERFVGYVKLLEGEEVSIAPRDRRATLKCGRATTQLPLDILANYPATEFVGESGSALKIPQNVALRLLKHTGFAISAEESKYILSGALLEVFDGKVRMVGTDGHRMAIYTVSLESLVGHGAVGSLLPLHLLKALEKGMKDSSDQHVALSDDPNASSLSLRVSGALPVDIVCRKMVGTFPNYRGVIPQGSPEVFVTVNATEMLASIMRCVAMSDRENFAVRLTVSRDSIGMKSVDSTAGETEESIQVGPVGEWEPFTTGFNGQYLVDVLKVCKGDVEIKFSKPANNVPMVMSCSPEDGEEFDYVVMPMKV